MIRINNITLKDIPDAKTKAILVLRKKFGLPMKGAKDHVEKILSDGFYDLGIRDYDNPFDVSRLYLSSVLLEIFDGELVNDEERSSNCNTELPDGETILALNWRDGLSEEEKKKIELIIKWETRGCIFVAVC